MQSLVEDDIITVTSLVLRTQQGPLWTLERSQTGQYVAHQFSFTIRPVLSNIASFAEL